VLKYELRAFESRINKSLVLWFGSKKEEDRAKVRYMMRTLKDNDVLSVSFFVSK
jgi:hypothetical protein